MGGGERTVIVCPVPSGLMIYTTTMYIGRTMDQWEEEKGRSSCVLYLVVL